MLPMLPILISSPIIIITSFVKKFGKMGNKMERWVTAFHSGSSVHFLPRTPSESLTVRLFQPIRLSNFPK